jgi:hypothetical protein
MSAPINNGGPAFPTDHGKNVTEGMTLRDYMAVKAMQGLLSMNRSSEFVTNEGVPASDDEDGTLFAHTKFLAQEAYMIADAMLRAREAA